MKMIFIESLDVGVKILSRSRPELGLNFFWRADLEIRLLLGFGIVIDAVKRKVVNFSIKCFFFFSDLYSQAKKSPPTPSVI